jgi:hypothetical protein
MGIYIYKVMPQIFASHHRVSAPLLNVTSVPKEVALGQIVFGLSLPGQLPAILPHHSAENCEMCSISCNPKVQYRITRAPRQSLS